MSLADVRSSRSSPSPEECPECDTSASVTSDLHKYQVACTCKPASVQYACADDPGPPPPAKTDTPPALPPRPPVSTLATSNRRNNATLPQNSNVDPASCGRRRKYAWWCVGCGALAAALGGLLAAAHILLRAYTASPHHLETVPAAVPAAMLVLTGVCIMSLARRRNRYSYMIKVVGACCLVCALTCLLVTITTTVIHMNKLQTLKCEYTKLTRTCTCYSKPTENQHGQETEGVRCVFEGVTDCGVVHGVLYWCLRGVFVLSVTAVLVCIFSCMLAYQLLSHERKKMYWEQLELRCRSLYRPPVGQAVPVTGRPAQNTCSCCAQCHPAQPAWDISLQHRFWAPGRIGNLYSPNPGSGRKNSAWSWFPWPRSSQNSRCRMGVPQSGDSAYGFCDTDSPQNPNPDPAQPYEERSYPNEYPRTSQSFQRAPHNFPRTSNFQQPATFTQSVQRSFNQNDGFGEGSGSFDSQTGVWGPPPPYSPQGRSGSRHHLHHQDPATATLLHHHHIDHRNSMPIDQLSNMPAETHSCNRNSSYMPHLIPTDMSQDLTRINPELLRLNPDLARMNPELLRLNPDLARINPDLLRLNPDLARVNPELLRLNPDLVRINPELLRLNPDLARINPELLRLNPDLARINPELLRLNPELCQQELLRLQELAQNDARFNTLRGHLVSFPNCPSGLALSLANLHRDCRMADDTLTIECLHQKNTCKDDMNESPKQGKENLGFQNDKHSPLRASMQDCRNNQNAESEVYFADVSSCCNVSVKAECCVNPNVSALVGTIENHPESTSESDTGSFTLTRQQRPQPQALGTKRRTRNPNLKSEKIRNDTQMELNSSIRMTDLNMSSHSRLNESLRMNESTHSRLCDPNHSRICERMNESISRLSDHSRLSDRMCDPNHSRMNDSSSSRLSERLNESISRLSDPNHSRMSEASSSRISERLNESLSRFTDQNHSRMSDRMNELNGSKRLNLEHILHPRQSSLDSTNSRKDSPEFFVPPPPLTPMTPNTEESVVSDDEQEVKPESSKCLGPDSQYEPKELKPSHHHCYSDTNTMDSGWQSGSEKHSTD